MKQAARSDVYKETLERISFSNYEQFYNPDIAFCHFVTRLDCLINTVFATVTVRVKNKASERFDGEITEKIHTREKLYKKIK